MPKVIIECNTVAQECERILYVVDNLDFYIKNNYKIGIPQGLDNYSTHQEIEKKATIEYDPDEFLEKTIAISRDWKKIEKKFFQNAEKLLKIKPLETYHCYITKYGTGGSYNPPNSIILNIRSNFFGFYAIAHETIHLLIHDLIEANGISHWQKERLVDRYFFKILDVERFQKIPVGEDVSNVDEIFAQFNEEGAEKVIKQLAEM